MNYKRIPDNFRLAAIPKPIFDRLLRNTGPLSNYRSVNLQVQDVLDEAFLNNHPCGWVEWYKVDYDYWNVPIKKILISEFQFTQLQEIQNQIAEKFELFIQISDIIAFTILVELPDMFEFDDEGRYTCCRAVLAPERKECVNFIYLRG